MRTIVAALLLALPGAALAQQWVNYARDTEGAVSPYDPTTLERDGDTVRVSIRRDFANVADMPQRVAVERWHYVCSNATAGWISFTTYDAAGAVMEQRNLSPAEVEIRPLVRGSTGYTLYERICGRPA